MRLSGRLGVSSSDSLRKALTASAAAARDHSLVVDLTGVSYMSSAGFSAFEFAARLLSDEGRELILCGPTDPVKVVLRFLGPRPNLVVEESAERAVERAFRSSL